MKRKSIWNTRMLTLMAAMAAIIYVVTMFSFPLLASKVHFGGSMCLVAGMLLGPAAGGIAAGLGSAVYDVTHGYDVINILITFASKFAMAWVCGLLTARFLRRERKLAERTGWAFLSAAAGALSYVALYMLKTWIFQRYVYGYPPEAAFVTLTEKLAASLINALAGTVTAPLFYQAVRLPLERTGVLARLK